MKKLGDILRLRIFFGFFLLAALCFGPAGHIDAQTGESADQAVPSTITITKEVEVFEFEGQKVAVDQYQVVKGDSLVKLLKSRGLLTSGSRQEQAKVIGFVRSLNPEIKDLNSLNIGQTIILPSLPRLEAEAKSPEDAAKTPVVPATVTETVKEYERASQGGQSEAKVKVMVHRTTDGSGEAAPAPGTTTRPTEAQASQPSQTPAAEPAKDPAPTAESTSPAPTPAVAETAAEQTPTPAASGTAPPAAQHLDFPSGNVGALAVEPQSQVVYRTVKVRRGDTLERLLRREGMHRDLIYGQLLKVTLELNPEIKNQDLIFTGAEIKIPAAGDYLKTLAGVDPQEVRTAAAAISERRNPVGGGAGAGARGGGGSGARAAVLELPDEAATNAKNTLGLIFTRLGERLIASGVRSIPAGQEAFELDAATFPIVELGGGRQLVLDPGSKLNRAAVDSLRAQNYQVFQTKRGETLDRVLDRIWSLCGYYRIYKKDRTYEGGTDIRLKISSDWIIWTTQEAWNAGQPLVVNRARNAETHTDSAWIRFLEDHGIKLIDIHHNSLLPAPQAPESKAELKVASLNSRNTTFLAAELVKNLGVEPKVGVQLDLGRDQAEAAVSSITAPVLWERGKDKIVLDFGELPYDASQTLRQNGYKLITVRAENEAAIDGVLEGFGLKVQDGLIISAPAGGPKMSLTIKGRVVTVDGKKFFITNLALPSGLATIMEPDITILKY